MNPPALWWVIFVVADVLGTLGLLAWMMLHQDDKI